ncbi:MAG TPA: LysM peptidoglycan-binding domain-containing protein [Phycisphaerae bacterium]|nr:LysM peptidoglycan-binding domain-containing protein [Phycisphaerae bacterium]
MRTDVKIGVAAGLLLVLAFVVYQAVFSGGDGKEPNQPGPEVARVDRAGQGGENRESGPGGGDVVLPRFGGLRSTPGTPRPVSPTPANPLSPVGLPTTPPEPAVPEIRETPTLPETPTTPPEPPVVPMIRETPIAPPGPLPVVPAIRETPTTPPIVPIIRETPSGPWVIGMPTPIAPGSQTTYVVQKGDSGFWAVAEKVYGDGRLWTEIRKANPGADTNALRPGQKLVIPPRPASRPAGEGAGAEMGAGGVVVSPTGQRSYLVRKGDAGFWGIAQEVYGNGKYWSVLAKANPQFNSASLKPGDRLVVPEKPAATSGPVAGGPVILPGPGQKVYVVQKTDTTGFSGIARKAYGDSAYWPLIAEANASVRSESLQVGQKLILPELTDEAKRRLAGSATMRTAPRPRPRPKDVEDIGPRPVYR